VQKLALDSDERPLMEVSRTFTISGTPLFGVKDDFDVAQAMFDLPKADDYLSKPVETHTSFAVLQLKEKTVASRDDFEAAKSDLMASARDLRRAEVLTSYISRLRAHVKKLELNPKHTGSDKEGDDPSSPAEQG
jgi:hypothetical protein